MGTYKASLFGALAGPGTVASSARKTLAIKMHLTIGGDDDVALQYLQMGACTHTPLRRR